MALKSVESTIDHKPKRTSIGGGKVKKSSRQYALQFLKILHLKK